METKTFEIRDRMTFIPAVAVHIAPTEPVDAVLMAKAGFRTPGTVLLCYLANNQASHDPYQWGDRTLRTAHLHIEEHWHDLQSGAVVDVEFILGETDTPKESEVGL